MTQTKSLWNDSDLPTIIANLRETDTPLSRSAADRLESAARLETQMQSVLDAYNRVLYGARDTLAVVMTMRGPVLDAARNGHVLATTADEIRRVLELAVNSQPVPMPFDRPARQQTAAQAGTDNRPGEQVTYKLPRLTAPERAAVRAALTLYSRALNRGGDGPPFGNLKDLATGGGEFVALDAAGIGDLLGKVAIETYQHAGVLPDVPDADAVLSMRETTPEEMQALRAALEADRTPVQIIPYEPLPAAVVAQCAAELHWMARGHVAHEHMLLDRAAQRLRDESLRIIVRASKDAERDQ